MTAGDFSALKFWQVAEDIAWIMVIVGCIGEGMADFTNFPKDENGRHKMGRLSWLILLAGLALEFLSAGKVTTIKDLEVARLGKEAADAKLEVARLTTPRPEKFNAEAFKAALKGKPKIQVELLYQAEDSDSFLLEVTIKHCLNAEGWTVLGPRPVKADDIPPGNIGSDYKNSPLIFRMGAAGVGMAITANRLTTGELADPIQVLCQAITASRSGLGVTQTSAGFIGSIDPRMPDDLIRLVIVPKYGEW